MRSWIRNYSFILALVLMMALPSLAQINSATRGGIGGTVYDSSGAVMPGVTVTITGPQGVYTVKTDAAGRYELDGQVPGSYKVVVEIPGFKRYISERNLSWLTTPRTSTCIWLSAPPLTLFRWTQAQFRSTPKQLP